MSSEPLKEYFKILCMFALSKYETVNKNTTKIDVSKVGDLINQDCLSGIDTSNLSYEEYRNVKITTHGAVVLAEWSTILEKQSIKGRVMNIIERLLWIIIVVLITVATK